jgi:DNA-binding CsgD family transcriptional regulator
VVQNAARADAYGARVPAEGANVLDHVDIRGNRDMALIEASEKLLDRIYDTAADTQLWCTTLREIAGQMNGQGGILFGVSMKANGFRALHFEYNGGLDEACNRAHRERHMGNPWSAAMYSKPVGCVVFSDEFVPLRTLQRTSFYDEVLHPQDVAHNAMVSLAARNDFRVAFNICRSSRGGPYEDSEWQFLGRLVPHLNRALLLGFRLDGYRALQQAAYDALDRLAVGVILLDRRERIVYANQPARLFDMAAGPLRFRNGKVEATSSVDSRRLEVLIRAALQGAPMGTMSLQQCTDGGLLSVLVTPVRSRDLDRFGGAGLHDAAVMIFIVAPANRLGVPADWLIEAYRLTPSEAKVALAIASGRTIPEAALHLGLTANTIKTHLSKVFAKTGVSRQSELARLIASIGLVNDAGSSSDGSG